MNHIRALIVHPAVMSVEAQLGLHGLQQMVEQEGLAFIVCAAEQLRDQSLRAGDVLLVAELQCFTDAEEAAVVAAAREIPVIWCGLPREDASPELLELLGIREMAFAPTWPFVTDLKLAEHPVTAPFSEEWEVNLKLKHVPYLSEGTVIEGEEVIGIWLEDGTRLAPGMVVRDETPRRVVWSFPLGYFFAVATCRHIELRRDAEWLSWPIMAYLDVLRGVLRECLRWCRPEASLVRKYYWPVADGVRPTGVCVTTHDLCGYSEEGVRFICETCDRLGSPTVFFDMPPIRLDAGEVGEHDIALHISGAATLDEIVEGKRALEERHGREIIGWRRHGRTEIEHYPQIWRNIERAGILWGDSFPCQSHPKLSSCSPCGTGNRLPFDIMDLETGRRMKLLNLQIFDSQDPDRLSGIGYGMRLDWEGFCRVVEGRLDHAAKHHLLAGYLLHGWTAGATEDVGRFHGALDCKRMLPHIIEQAHARGMIMMGGDELYRWWVFRRDTEIDLSGAEPRAVTPGDEFDLALDILEPMRQQ
ncbi:MAG: hypothetical protein J7M38_07785 [Armatimonadetes bacterium]|nr:hypothetical protein [Armatimonadota bacterium]